MSIFNHNWMSASLLAGLIIGTSGNVNAQEPTALIEDITGAPNAGIEMMDYVFDGQKIDLGEGGILTLAYFSNCRVEIITGGKATIGVDESKSDGGKIDATIPECQQAASITTADASEAGAGVKRATPFGDDNWLETTIKTTRPIFKWQSSEPGVEIKITSVDEETPINILSVTTDKAFLIYPSDAPELEMGKPYLVEVTTNDTIKIEKKKMIGQIEKIKITEIPLEYIAVFSIDPGLEVAENVTNRTIRLVQK